MASGILALGAGEGRRGRRAPRRMMYGQAPCMCARSAHGPWNADPTGGANHLEMASLRAAMAILRVVFRVVTAALVLFPSPDRPLHVATLC